MRRTISHPDMPVDEIMRRWPATIHVFLRHHLVCVGCPIGIFHTVAEACAAHGIDLDTFWGRLGAAMNGDAAADPATFDDPGATGAPPAGCRDT